MPIIVNKELYNEVKKEADEIYDKPSAYKSGWIVKTYKERGGIYKDDNKPKNLQRWYKEHWGDIGGLNYPVYRPFKRINKDTPLTVNEIDPKQAIEQIKLKQVIKGNKNLPPFIMNDKYDELLKYSNPDIVYKKAKKLFGRDVIIAISARKDKKYMIYDPNNDKYIHFGQMGYEDFTKHKNEDRRLNYLHRSSNIKGDWKDNPYSPNNLSRNLLW